MYPVIFAYSLKNEFMHTTKILQNELGEFQVISSNYFNLKLYENELKELTADVIGNKINFGFVPNYIKQIEFSEKYIDQVQDCIQMPFYIGKIISNGLYLETPTWRANFSIHEIDAKTKTIYGPTIYIK